MMRLAGSAPRVLIVVAASAALLAAPGAAEQVILEPLKDNTIFSESESLSNGIGLGLFAGNTAANATRRALLAFDVAGAIPAGATITSAQLRLRLTLSNSGPKALTLHRLTDDWGEANSTSTVRGGGMGAPARPGDATWGFRFFNTERWATGGGDFIAAASATQSVATLTFHTWGSTAQMIADVQLWLDTPNSNFGWLLRGDETTSTTAKRLASSETTTANNRPRLTIDYEPPLGAATATPTVTLAPTATQTSTIAPASATATRTRTAPSTSTASVAPTGTATAMGVSSATSTHTPVETASSAPTSSTTPTARSELPTATASHTPAATGTATAMASPTASPAPPSVTPTDTPTGISCVGDCDGDGEVAINEVILGVSIALGNQPLDACPAFDPSGNGRVEINELINAVSNALNGCP